MAFEGRAMPWGAIIGGAASLFGAGLSSRAASEQAEMSEKAAREAREFYHNQTLSPQARQYRMLYGADAARRLRQDFGADAERLFGREAGQDTQLFGDSTGQLAEIDQQLGAPPAGFSSWDQYQSWESGPGNQAGSGRGLITPAQRELLNRRGVVQQAQGRPVTVPGSPAIKGMFDEAEFSSGGPGILDQYRQLAGESEQRGNAVLGDLDRRQSALQALMAEDDRRLGGLDDMAVQSTRQYGGARMSEIDRDASRAIEQGNRSASARARASGLGGSTLTQAIGENTRGVFERAQSAKNQIGDEQIRMLTGLQSQSSGRAGDRARMATGFRAAADNQAVAGRIAQNQNIEALRRAPLDLELQTLTGSTFNPYLGQDTTRYYPGVSGSAASMATWGNALSQAGSAALMYGLSQNGQNRNPQQNPSGHPSGSQMDEMYRSLYG